MSRLFLLLCCLTLLPSYGCNRYEQENDRLREEIKMLREQNDYAQAEIIGLKKELAELGARVKDEREALQKTLEEERAQMQKNVEDMRETLQKKAEADKKKGATPKKAQTKSDVSKNTPRSAAGALVKGSPEKKGASGNKANKAGKPTGATPDEE